MRMEEIYENEKVYKKYNINEIERMYNDASDFIAEEYGYVPDIEKFEVEIVADLGYELSYFNSIKITDIMGNLTIYVRKSKTIKGTDRK